MMRVSIVYETLGIVLLSELGCMARTEALAERFGSAASVCLGTLIANAILLLPILLGAGWLHRHLPHKEMLIICAGLFVFIGVSLALEALTK